MKKIVLVTLCSLVGFVSIAQRSISPKQQKKNERKERINELMKQEEEGALIFQNQSIFGLKLTTDGYAAFYELGKLKTPTKTNTYSLEIGERKHPKEEKLATGDSRTGFIIGNPYIFGKINNFYYAKLGIGQQRLIGGKGNKNGVAVAAVYSGGLTAGLLKPYYLQINHPQIEDKDVKYDNNDTVFLNPSYITGSSGLGKGFNEMKFVPGGFAKVGLRFDYGKYNEMVSAVEVGLGIEAYSQKMPIMLLNKEKQLFFHAYAAILFGRRK
ncbi:MAG TPA: hypothetical protein VF622_16450 [Segetibacter sp.]